MKWELDRREFVILTGAAMVGVDCSSPLDLGLMEDDSFDEVLSRLHGTDPLFDGGLSNHGPMAAEALVALEREDRVVAYISKYAKRLVRREEAPALADDERAGALGNSELRNQWIATYEAEVARRAPEEVVAADFSILVSGYAFALHGVLRTAHALRSVERQDTATRRREVAHGLGAWAALHNPLPGQPGAQAQTGNDVLQALAQVPMVPESRRKGSGLINNRLSVLDDQPDFVAAIEAVDLDAVPVSAAINELSAAAARLFVANGGNSILYLHAVTGTSALRLLLPALDASAQRLGLGYAFQMVAGMHAIQGPEPGVPASVESTTASAAELVNSAATTGDEHKIKLIEAALREHAVEPRPEFLAAAQAW